MWHTSMDAVFPYREMAEVRAGEERGGCAAFSSIVTNRTVFVNFLAVDGDNDSTLALTFAMMSLQFRDS
jgi:hypothetical protein